MANNDDKNLNDAVEQVQTENDDATSEEQQQNQQTATSTVATGAEALSAQLAEDALGDSGAATGDEESVSEESSEGAQAESGVISTAETNLQQSQSVDGTGAGETSADAPDQAAATSDTIGAQSIGGAADTSDAADVAAATTALGGAATGAAATAAQPASSQSGEDFDTQTNENTLEVNVFNTPENLGDDTPLEGGEEDFDTETTETQIEITVTAENDAAEVSGPINLTMEEDGTILITQETLLATASDIDGDTLTAQNLTLNNAGLGEINDNGDGTFSFTPAQDFNGDLDFSFEVFDGTVATPATLNMNVTPVNDAPDAGDKAFTMNEDGTITITDDQLLEGASDVDGDTLSIADVSYTGTDGVFTDNGDGTYTFAPNENFNGDVDLSYTATDTDGASVEANIDIAVTPVNDPPVSGNLAYTIEEDGSITLNQEQLLSMASDIDGDDLTALNLRSDNPELGIIDNGDGTFTLSPTEDFNGELDITFDISDGQAITEANIDLTVTPVNDAPSAPSLNLTGEEDQVLEIDPDFILSQISDVDGDTITLENLSVRQPANASLSQNSDGIYELIGAQDWNGLIQLDYLVSDGTTEVSGSLDVDVIPVNDAPFANGNAHMTILEDGEITFNESDLVDLFGDVDIGDTLSLSKIITADGEDGGAINDNGDGTWTFTPSADFAGTVELQVVVTDEAGEEAALEMPIFVRPVADGAAITTDHDGPLVFGEDSTGHLGLNVEMLDDSEILSNMAITGFPVGFTVTDGENTIEITEIGQMLDVTTWNVGDLQLTPPEDYNGTFFLTVTTTTADYGDEGSDPNDAAAENTDFDIEMGESILFTTEDLLGVADYADVQEGDDVGMVHIIDRSQGEMSDNGDGTWTFTPAEGFNGNVDFAFVIERGDEIIDVQSTIGVQLSDSGEIGDVVPFNDNAVQITTEELMQGLDPDSGDITGLSYSGDDGTLIDNADGTWTFWPDPTFDGNVSLDIENEGGIEQSFGFNVESDNTLPDGVSEVDIAPVNSEAANDASQADYMAAPGDEMIINIPEDIVAMEDVDHVVISDIPEGAEINGGIENADGDTVISGDLSQPVTLSLGESTEGDVTMQISGFDSNDNAVEGASESLTMNISPDNAMVNSTADNADTSQMDGQDIAATGTDGGGVDVFDDSSLTDLDIQPDSSDDDYSGGLGDIG